MLPITGIEAAKPSERKFELHKGRDQGEED